ncbi:regulatory-associated protein of mTOR-like [Armigeres subalbatus]|uniref:regulatory-associated protein of mTOR-like n=1 Tax=Armigeres subalbatus TaxID=124917 RepID=UPI002ED29CDD
MRKPFETNMTQDVHPSWALAHLNTSVRLPDVALFDLTRRSYSWINVLWIPDRTEVRLHSVAQRVAHVDLEDSHYARAKFRSLPDASGQDLQRACQRVSDQIGASARPIVHYNCRVRVSDDGQKKMPKVNGNFWLNDDNYTGKLEEVHQDQVQKWFGTPGVVYLYECDSAEEFIRINGDNDNGYHLGACAAGQKLPLEDLLTEAICRPVRAAFKWHCTLLNNINLPSKLLPGDIADRQLLLGQLDWVLTLILDAIAWDSMPKDMFQQLFRGDLLTGTIYRRFILSQRMLIRAGCTPVSKPSIPDNSRHRLWAVWDRLMNMTMNLLEKQNEKECPIIRTFFQIILDGQYQQHLDLFLSAMSLSVQSPNTFTPLKAGWKKLGNDVQLQNCIVNQAIRLLQSRDKILRQKTTIFLTEVFAETPAAEELLKSEGRVNLLQDLSKKSDNRLLITTLYMQLLLEKHSCASDPAHWRALAAHCVDLMNHPDSDVRVWSVLLGQTISAAGLTDLRGRIEELLDDVVPKVRAAAVESWIASYSHLPEQKDTAISKLLTMMGNNSSSLVRRELAYALNVIASDRTVELIAVCKQEQSKPPEPSKSKGKAKAKQQQQRKGSLTSSKSELPLAKAWRLMVTLQVDPDPEVASAMQSVVTFVNRCVTEQESAGTKRKKKISVGSCPLATRAKLHERFNWDLTKDRRHVQQNGEEEASKENNAGALNCNPPIESRNPTLALLNHQLRSFQVQKVPQMVRFGARHEMVTVFKDHIAWQDSTNVNGKPHIFKHPTVPLVKVTSLLLDIPHRSSSLLVGYNDGSIRLWHVEATPDPCLVTAWQGLHDLNETTLAEKIHGIVMTSIGTRQLITGGDAKYLRKWDLTTQLTIGDISIGTDQPVSALASNGVYNIAAGLEGGTVRLFDTRAEADGKIAVGPKHSKPVRMVSLRQDEQTMVSVCTGGSVHLVDLRKMIPALKKWSWDTVPLDVAVHPRFDLVAFAGSDRLEVYSIDGERNSGLQVGAVCVDFHPKEAVLGAGKERDNAVVLYGDLEQNAGR